MRQKKYKRQISISLSLQVYKQLKKISEKEMVNLADLIRKIIKNFFSEEKDV
ncbi:MAG: ribbon-helix-helix domain-containing protein [Candidatus Goldbacteria bacterium]|nr:ribbon-helix-helix domain-containing protein [Candidatus Goldiibacteriota bacterium]